jgi:hypothetical protein
MNNFIKQVIEEKFASKSQQRFFYAKAKGGKNKKWSKWAKEYSDKTDYSKIPNKVEKEEEVDEIIDSKGNFARSKKPTDLPTKGITSNSTTDQAVRMGHGQMGIHGVHGTHTSLRYWAEGEELSKEKILEIAMGDALGYEETLGDDESFKKAYNHFTKELNLSDEEAMDRLKAMGYDPELPGDMVRLIENPKKFMEEYIESVVSKKKQKDSDIVQRGDEKMEKKEVHPIVKRQIMSLKDSLKSHGLSTDDVLEFLENKNE